MHALLEFLPLATLVIGFIIGKQVNPDEAMIFLSYGAVIGAILQLAIYKIAKIPMQKMTFYTALLLILFASATIILKNDFFIKSKLTIIPWGFALFFYFYALFKGQTFFSAMLGEQIQLANKHWSVVNWAWIIYNVLVGLINAIIMWQIALDLLNDNAWVIYRAATFGSSLVFIILQTVYIFKFGHFVENSDNDAKPESQSKIESEPDIQPKDLEKL